MTRALSKDIRERVVSAVEGGMTRRSAAKRFGVAQAPRPGVAMTREIVCELIGKWRITEADL